MDSHKINMYAGGVIGSLLAFLLLNFFADLVYVGRGHSEHEQLAFAVAVEDAGHDTESTADAVDYAALLAAADAADGEKVFNKCKSCHKLEAGANGVGPTLHGVVGRTVGTEAGFAFSDAMKAHGGEWDLVSLSEFLAAPKTAVPGTKMGFAGLPKPEDRVNLIVYLNQASGAPVELTAPASDAAPPAPESSAPAPESSAPAPESSAPASDATAPADTQGAAGADSASTTVAAAAKDAATEGDAAAGETVYKKCKACHSIEAGENKVGPSLHGVVGRAIGAEAGYNYSDAMKSHGGEWTPEKLAAFLENPKGDVPGTKMTFPGLKKPEDRANIISYLKTLGGS